MIQKADIDSTIDDIHRTRERLAEKFGGNIKAILDDARRRQSELGRPMWDDSSANNSIPPSGQDTISGSTESSTAAE